MKAWRCEICEEIQVQEVEPPSQPEARLSWCVHTGHQWQEVEIEVIDREDAEFLEKVRVYTSPPFRPTGRSS